LSVLTFVELRRGAALARRTKSARSTELDEWIDTLEREFENQILPVSLAVADTWARISTDRSRPVIDTLLAATAITHELTLVTRNIRDVADTGARLLNPFER